MRVGFFIIMVLLFAADGSVSGADSPLAARAVLVHPDGSIILPASAIAREHPGANSAKTVYEFGLPPQPPVKRWLEEDRLPICHTAWEHQGIRYTQTVLMTRMEPGELANTNLSYDSVLMIQIKGENLTSEYAEGSAAFSVRHGDKRMTLDLRNGSIYFTDNNGSMPLSVVEIAPAGIAGTNGLALRFRGNIPPGNSGAMTISIPMIAAKREAALDRLRDLDFEEEFSRVKRFWSERVKTNDLHRVPVGFTRSIQAIK